MHRIDEFEQLPTMTEASHAWLHDVQAVRERLAGIQLQALESAGKKRAAVAVVIGEAGPGAGIDGLPVVNGLWSRAPALLVTRRAAGLRSHAGQWALPGGRMDAGETPEQTALRELREELGLALQPQHVAGRLDDYVTHSGYAITPVVMVAGAAAPLIPSADEVASVHRLPVTELLRPDAPILNQPRAGGAPILRMPVGQRWIAAPTAAFLLQFREWLLLGQPTRVAHFEQPYFARR